MNELDQYLKNTIDNKKSVIEEIEKARKEVERLQGLIHRKRELIVAFDKIINEFTDAQQESIQNQKNNEHYDHNGSWTYKWVFGLSERGLLSTTREVGKILLMHGEDGTLNEIVNELSIRTGYLQQRNKIVKVKFKEGKKALWALPEWFDAKRIKRKYLPLYQTDNKEGIEGVEKWYPDDFSITEEVMKILKNADEEVPVGFVIRKLINSYDFVEMQAKKDREVVRKAVSGVLARMKTGETKYGSFMKFVRNNALYYSLK